MSTKTTHGDLEEANRRLDKPKGRPIMAGVQVRDADILLKVGPVSVDG